MLFKICTLLCLLVLQVSSAAEQNVSSVVVPLKSTTTPVIQVTGVITENGTIYEFDDPNGKAPVEARNGELLTPQPGEHICNYGNVVLYSDMPCNQLAKKEDKNDANMPLKESENSTVVASDVEHKQFDDADDNEDDDDDDEELVQQPIRKRKRKPVQQQKQQKKKNGNNQKKRKNSNNKKRYYVIKRTKYPNRAAFEEAQKKGKHQPPKDNERRRVRINDKQRQQNQQQGTEQQQLRVQQQRQRQRQRLQQQQQGTEQEQQQRQRQSQRQKQRQRLQQLQQGTEQDQQQMLQQQRQRQRQRQRLQQQQQEMQERQLPYKPNKAKTIKKQQLVSSDGRVYEVIDINAN